LRLSSSAILPLPVRQNGRPKLSHARASDLIGTDPFRESFLRTPARRFPDFF